MNAPFFSRRQFLKHSALAATAVCTAGTPIRALAAGDYGGNKIPIALQLYSVRQDCAKDLVATLKAVATMGYKGVEFAGYYGREATTLRKLLDDVGLKCCGSHIGLETLLGDSFQRTIEFNRTLGNKFLIVPGLAKKYTETRAAWQKTAAIFNELAAKVKPEGLRVGYHNHTIEFKELDGELPWDTFFGHTDKAVVMQFDTGNAMQGGGDATVYLQKYPGRAATVHLKPFSKKKANALLGDDELPWPKIFNLCETVGATEWYIVEYESDAYAPLVSVEKSLRMLCEWGKC
ncbi:MAG: sugar phosphate isomerase/epimerase [Verrucomicrobia bacterium]|nr:sugar phosphate isomerase/epimerase [Verrucomicrobiota bacterium]